MNLLTPWPDHQPALATHTLGVGPDVVLLHGWGMHSGVWEQVAEALAEQCRVTVVDLPGHGDSRLVAVGHTLEDWCAAVAAVTPAAATWVGWSLGGLIAQHLAMAQPERVSRLVLVNSTPCFVQRPAWPHALSLPMLRQFAEQLRQNYQAVLKRFIALEFYGSHQAATQLRQIRAMLFQQSQPDDRALAAGLTLLETTDLRTEWSRLRCPILLLMGERDQLVPVEAGTTLVTRYSNAQLRVFTGAGHAPFLSHRLEFVAELRAFLHA